MDGLVRDQKRTSAPPCRSRIRCFLTVDQGIEYQQNPVGLALAIVVMVAMSNDIDDLRPLMPRVRETLNGASPGTVVKVKI
jgi:hypothetical protein